MYKPTRPNWYFSYINIPDLQGIQNEILAAYYGNTPRITANKYKIALLSKDLLPISPILYKYLQQAGIKNKFNYALVAFNTPSDSEVHVDVYPSDLYGMHSVSLNIPLVDAENSYTAFYRTEKTRLNLPNKESLSESDYYCCPLNECSEVARVRYTSPALVNISVLHRGINELDTRMICGLRFMPELTKQDIQRLGVTNPFTQVF